MCNGLWLYKLRVVSFNAIVIIYFIIIKCLYWNNTYIIWYKI